MSTDQETFTPAQVTALTVEAYQRGQGESAEAYRVATEAVEQAWDADVERLTGQAERDRQSYTTDRQNLTDNYERHIGEIEQVRDSFKADAERLREQVARQGVTIDGLQADNDRLTSERDTLQNKLVRTTTEDDGRQDTDILDTLENLRGNRTIGARSITQKGVVLDFMPMTVREVLRQRGQGWTRAYRRGKGGRRVTEQLEETEIQSQSDEAIARRLMEQSYITGSMFDAWIRNQRGQTYRSMPQHFPVNPITGRHYSHEAIFDWVQAVNRAIEQSRMVRATVVGEPLRWGIWVDQSHHVRLAADNTPRKVGQETADIRPPSHFPDAIRLKASGKKPR